VDVPGGGGRLHYGGRGVTICPLILSDCAVFIVREVSELSVWYSNVKKNPLGLCGVWPAATDKMSTGGACPGTPDTYKVPFSFSLDTERYVNPPPPTGPGWIVSSLNVEIVDNEIVKKQ
jgi:hypothetical protein